MDRDALLRKYAVRNALDYGEAQKDAVIGKVFGENPELKQQAGEVVAQAEEIIADVNAMSDKELEDAAKEYDYADDDDDEHDPLPTLEGAEDGDVVLRFAPNPNGPPTLGSSRGMVINGELKQKYDGKLILRFDDTDPRTKRPLKTDEYDAYEMYQEDYAWLGYEVDEVIHSSQQFDRYIDVAETLIEQGHAYVCFCSPEEGRNYRENGEACPHRNEPVEEHLAHWEEMQTGGIAEGDATLKIKTDMQHKNPAIRDFVAFRIIDDPNHPITGNTYRVWPLLDFAGAIEDHDMGTTHIVRGKDLRASTKRQKYIYDYLDWTYPHVTYWGRINMQGLETPMSTSTLAEMIADGELDGWNDVRAPTVRALKRRGFQPEALRDFWVDMGVTENDVEASTDTLNSFNRKVIDPEADRYFFVENPVKLAINGIDDDVTATISNHPQEDHGTHQYTLSEQDGQITVYADREDVVQGVEDGFLRLKDLCNVHEINSADESTFHAQYHSTDHSPAVERDAGIVQWTPTDGKDCTVHMPDGSTVTGICEPQTPEAVIQFVRFGFVNVADANETVDAFYTHS